MYGSPEYIRNYSRAHIPKHGTFKSNRAYSDQTLHIERNVHCFAQKRHFPVSESPCPWFPTASLPPTTTTVSTALVPRSLRHHRARRQQDKGYIETGIVQYFDARADADIIALAQRRLEPAPGRSPLALERKNRYLQRIIHLQSCGTPAHAPAFYIPVHVNTPVGIPESRERRRGHIDTRNVPFFLTRNNVVFGMFYNDDPILLGYFSLPLENIRAVRKIAVPKEDEQESKSILDQVNGDNDSFAYFRSI
ncbi:hypothetical protein K438DRAFT_1753903 [Mycena galopus ATCC 62051]|nr:hypothetical protein K438DRAFT_1753903 [Mycena galopus ATCC 62051]